MEPAPSRLELSPLNFLRRNAQALGERPAVVHGERRLNYFELEERCKRLATALRDRGELNLHPIHPYGLTETYGPIMGCSWQPQWDELELEERGRLLARQGHTYNGADLVRVVDDDMRDVARDGETVGEVVMRGNSVMTGYHGQDDKTADPFRHGWFHSGDLAVWHLDGYVELRDRSKTSSSPAGRTSRASRSSRRSPNIGRSSNQRWWRCRMRNGASVRKRSWSSRRARNPVSRT